MSGKTPQTTLKSSKCKRVQLELSQEARTEILAEIFKNLHILLLHSQYTLSLLEFVVDNKSMQNLNSDIHNTSMRQKFNIHQHSANLSLYKKRSSLLWHRNVQQLPLKSKKTNNIKQFTTALKHYILTHSF
jgi:hypothetical protein